MPTLPVNYPAETTAKNLQVIPKHKRIDYTDLVWLVYLVFFLIEPIHRNSARYWLETVAVMAAFVAGYMTYLRTANLRLRLVLLACMYLAGAALFPWNGGAPSFMIYAAALLPLTIESLPWIVFLLTVDALTVVGVGYRFHIPMFASVLDAGFMLLVGITNYFAGQKMRADCKLRMKQEEIEALAAVAERERIARDLHDVLGHTLSVIVLKSELAGRLIDRELSAGERGDLLRARAEMGDVERTARTALAEVREAIGGYRARGLHAEIEAARNALAAAGVTLTLEGELKPASLTAAEETVLALALREAVTNIVRHAKATTCCVRMVFAHGRHRLFIEDDGQHAVAREGNGLRGMRERVEALGGELSLTRQGGTQLLIELPQHAGVPT